MIGIFNLVFNMCEPPMGQYYATCTGENRVHLSIFNSKNMKFLPSKNLQRQDEILSLPRGSRNDIPTGTTSLSKCSPQTLMFKGIYGTL